MNRRTSKLIGYVARALQEMEGVKPPKGLPNQLFNPLANLKRKLKREWNKKPKATRNAQRMGLIRTLVAMEESRV